MTVDPSLTVSRDLAIVAVGRLRESWPWLAELVEPGRARRTQRHLTDAARVQLDRLVLAERAERVKNAQRGLRPFGESAAPINLAVVDAQVFVQETLEDACWQISTVLRFQPGMSYQVVGRTGDERVTNGMNYLAAMLPHVDDANIVTTAMVRLGAADQLARSVAGVASDRRWLDTACPSCGRRSLHAEIGSSDYREWAVLCDRDDCRCRGIDCGCKRPLRYPGSRHAWPEREWEQLALVLTRRDAA